MASACGLEAAGRTIYLNYHPRFTHHFYARHPQLARLVILAEELLRRLPLLRGREKEAYLRELVAATAGHIGPALLCHAQALHSTEEGRLEAGRVVRPNLPFPAQLTT